MVVQIDYHINIIIIYYIIYTLCIQKGMSICLIVIFYIMKLYLKIKLYLYVIFTNGKLRKIINNDLPNIDGIRKNTTTNGCTTQSKRLVKR